MSVATFEGIVDRGQIRLPEDLQLPDQTKVFVVVPEYQSEHSHRSDRQVETAYQHLEARTDTNTQELFLLGRGIKASTIWHDRFILRLSPETIAFDRDLPMEAVYEALDYCQKHWEDICAEKEREKQ
jgi:hypothetical protein